MTISLRTDNLGGITPITKKQNNKFKWVLYARKLRKKHIFKVCQY